MAGQGQAGETLEVGGRILCSWRDGGVLVGPRSSSSQVVAVSTVVLGPGSGWWMPCSPGGPIDVVFLRVQRAILATEQTLPRTQKVDWAAGSGDQWLSLEAGGGGWGGPLQALQALPGLPWLLTELKGRGPAPKLLRWRRARVLEKALEPEEAVVAVVRVL